MGVPNTKIADEFGVSERAIRYHLGRPEPALTGGSPPALTEHEVARRDTIVEMLDKQILLLAMKLQDAEEIKITRASDYIKGMQTLKDAMGMRSIIQAQGDMNLTPGPEQPPERLDLNQLKAIQEMPADARRKLISELRNGTEQ
jgi:hypothetical protein